MPEPERPETETCQGHRHIAVQFIQFANRPFAQYHFSQSVEEARAFAWAFMHHPEAITIVGFDLEININ